MNGKRRLASTCVRETLAPILPLLATIAITLGLGCASCPAQPVVLVGVGSSVPLPLYTAWTETYNKRDPRFRMRYLPVGTDEGIRMLNQGNGDFGAGEVPLEKERNGSKLRVVPTILIGIVPIYNLPGRSVELRFTGDLLAQIFLGRVKTWNSPAIAKLNQGISLPDLPIKVIYRPGGKGSNYVFTEFLSRSNPQFRSAIGISPSPNWPVGTAAERSADMVKGVKDNLGSIGYVELQYAIQLRVAYGLVQNPSGQFVRASDKTIAAAWEAVASLNPESFNASLTDAPGPNSYPITSFSWIYIPVDLGNQAHAAAMTDLLNWVFTEGQTIAAQLGYSPLPSRLLQKVQAKVKVLH